MGTKMNGLKSKSKSLSAILLAALLGASCTEEVASELKNKESSSPLGNTSVNLRESSIRLIHNMDEDMSFVMHKAGTTSTPCELSPSSSDGFDAVDYFRDPSATDDPQVIDCILEAQENDLYQQGANIEIQVDPGLCEYVSYTPFKFVEAQYGNTNKTVYQVECATSESECSTGGHCGRIYDNAGASGSSVATLANSLSQEQLRCKFDYSSETGLALEYGENCDEGSINIVKLYIDNAKGDFDLDADTEDTCPVGAYTFTQDSVETIECGGDHHSCMGGPAIEHFGSNKLGTSIYSNSSLSEFSQTFELQAPIERRELSVNAPSNNMYLANYSRICADTTVTKDETGADYSGYANIEFHGFLSESIRYDSVGGGTISPTQYSDAGGEDDYIAYAENPWRAVHHTSPYYSFKCLDQARDVKAQIRLYIRDWDRKYDGVINSFSYVTDIHTTLPLMDSNDTHIGDGGAWNDITDWDDWFGNGFIWENNQCTTTSPGTSFSDDSIYSSSTPFPGHL